jgi:hypothetical protein
MGSFKRPGVFHPLDLEIMDCVYETAWAHLEAREPFRDTTKTFGLWWAPAANA